MVISRVHVVIYISKLIYIYINFGGVHGSPFIYRLLFIKVKKIQEYDHSWNQIMHFFFI